MMSEKKKNRLMMMASAGSVTTALVLIVLKVLAFLGTGSMAILSGLFDSVQDLMTSVVNVVAVHQAVQPADKSHRFGHGKAQGIGGLMQALIIGVAAFMLMAESISHLMKAQPVKRVELGIVVALISLGLTVILVIFQNYVIKKTDSLSIKADRAHYTGDILMNVGVLISLVLSAWLKLVWIDGVFGIMVALYLFWAIKGVMKEACSMLMDKELPDAVREEVKKLALSVPLVKNVSCLRTREGGNKRFVQFYAQFDGALSLHTAHEELDEIERVIHAKYPEMEVIIHAEPYDETKKKKECRP